MVRHIKFYLIWLIISHVIFHYSKVEYAEMSPFLMLKSQKIWMIKSLEIPWKKTTFFAVFRWHPKVPTVERPRSLPSSLLASLCPWAPSWAVRAESCAERLGWIWKCKGWRPRPPWKLQFQALVLSETWCSLGILWVQVRLHWWWMAATKEYLQKVKPLTVADDEERQLNTKEGDHASTSSSSYYYCYY